jgi:hypothetical protein
MSILSSCALLGAAVAWTTACGDVSQRAASVDARAVGIDAAVRVDAGDILPPLDAAPAVDAAPPLTRLYAFVTAADFDGALGGIAGGDLACANAASAAGLPGVYKAWLTGQDPATAPASRFRHGTVPYVLVDGTVIANDFADLTSGALRHALDQDEHGATLTAPSCSTWTGTGADGTPSTLLAGSQGQADHTCNSWSSNASTYGYVGGASALTTSQWTETCGGDFGVCAQRLHLDCFQQP